MTSIDFCAAKLWGIMQHWLGWREGMYAAQCDSSKAPSAVLLEAHDKSQRWLLRLGSQGFEYPRDLAVNCCHILAEARGGYTVREFIRNLLEASNDPQADIPEPDRWIVTLHYLTKEARQQAVAT